MSARSRDNEVINTPPPIGERSIVMSVSVCVRACVFSSLRSYLRNYTSDLHQFFLHSLISPQNLIAKNTIETGLN